MGLLRCVQSPTVSSIPRTGLIEKPFLCGHTAVKFINNKRICPDARKLKFIDFRAQASGSVFLQCCLFSFFFCAIMEPFVLGFNLFEVFGRAQKPLFRRHLLTCSLEKLKICENMKRNSALYLKFRLLDIAYSRINFTIRHAV